MMHPMAPHGIGLSLALWSGSSLASPFPLQILAEGSATEEETGALAPGPTQLTTRSSTLLDYQTTSTGDLTDGAATALDQVVEFLHRNLIYIVAGASVALLMLLIVCIAVTLKRKLRINAYYPCSFPAKMYVEQRDKEGGVKRFDQVPEKAPRWQQSVPVDSGQRLQQDIMRAVKGLRTPTKKATKVGEAAQADTPIETTDGERLVEKATEEAETKWHSQTEASNEESREQGISLKQTGQPDVDPEDSPHSGADPSPVQPDHRPESPLIQCDSPKIQLINGEKTSF
ncbi:transmembrane protein 119b [Gadus morhua]|nr:transmembrane protein 119-like [Gadus morhua]XP_030210821.1 transmembrane protein 119-like [Gadus morhua]